VFKSSWDKSRIWDQLIFLLCGFFLQFVFAQLLAAALVKSQWTCRVASGQELEVEVGMVLAVLAVLLVLDSQGNGARPLGQVRSLA